MAKEEFAIRCPHCHRWSYWTEHPKEKVLDSAEELRQIIEDLKAASLEGRQDDFHHPKLLRCKSLRGFCPVSFEAFVCRADEDPHKYSTVVESWLPKRYFQLRKADTHNVWNKASEGKYCGILFNTQRISRPRYIELESLMNKELATRLMAGICVDINLPLTFFAANIFESNDENKSLRRYWMPIEGYSQKQKLVPPRFNLFCERCRNLSMRKLIDEFESKGYNVDNCPAKPVTFGKDGKCMGKKAACVQEPKDWNHCPAFVEERKEKCPCYNSDLLLIGMVEDKWRGGRVPREGVWHRCHAGFREVAFPLEVHGHLIGVWMTGQFFSDPNEVERASELINSKTVSGVGNLTWDAIVGEEKDLDEARQILVGLELKSRREGESTYLLTETQAKQRIERLLPNLERFEKTLESHYTDFRAKSEFAFRQEILAYVRKYKKTPDFFKEPILAVLQRMQEFWAFRAVGFLCYSTRTKDVSLISYSYETESGVDEKGIGFPGEKVGHIDLDSREEHPRGWLYNPTVSKSPENPWIRQFVSLLEDARRERSINLPDKGCYFLVTVPFADKVCMFLLIARDVAKVSWMKVSKTEEVSDLCQEFIFGTCVEVIHEFTGMRVLNEPHVHAWANDLQQLERNIKKEITTEVSVPTDFLIEEVLKDGALCEKSRNNLLEAKTRNGKIISIVKKQVEKELRKLSAHR